MKKIMFLIILLSIRGYAFDCKQYDLESAYKVQFQFACSEPETDNLKFKIMKQFPKFKDEHEKNKLSIAMMVINDNSLDLDKIENIEMAEPTKVKKNERSEIYNIYTIYIKFKTGNIKRFQIGDLKIDPLEVYLENGVGLLDQ